MLSSRLQTERGGGQAETPPKGLGFPPKPPQNTLPQGTEVGGLIVEGGGGHLNGQIGTVSKTKKEKESQQEEGSARGGPHLHTQT